MMSSLTEEQKRRIEENRQRALAKRAVKTGNSPVKQSYDLKRRIEENKQKALAKLAEKSNKSPVKSSINLSLQTNFKTTKPGPSNKVVVAPSFASQGNTNRVNYHGGSEPKSLSGQSNVNYTSNQKAGSSNTTATNDSGSAIVYSKQNSSTSHTNTSTALKNSGDQWLNKNSRNNGNTEVKKTFSVQDAAKQVSAKDNIFTSLGKGRPVKGLCVLVSKERFLVDVGFSQPLVEVFKSMKTKLYDAVTRKWSFKLEEYDCLMSAVQQMKPDVQVEPLPKSILQTFSSQIKGKQVIPPSETVDLSRVDKILVDALLPFQYTGVKFGIQKNGRVLVADDMGLGKTIQAICLAAYYRDEWPLLVVVPSSVRFDWAQQIQRWLPSVDPQAVFVAVTGKNCQSSALVNIYSYDLMARKVADLKKRNFQVVIMDECHLLKNFKTARCKAAQPLLQNSRRVILLSGTPALSRPSELYTQISAVCPYLIKYQDFGVRYCDGKKNNWGWDFSGSSNMAELQLLLEERIMIRRLKKDVLTQLPSKVRQMILLDPGSIKINKDMKNSAKLMNIKSLKGMERRGALLEYFHHTGAAKIPAVRDYILDLLEGDRKFLIFAHHQEVLDAIEDVVKSKLGSGNHSYMRIDGKTTPEQRNFYCKKFQTQDSMKVAILSITAANAGLNLSAANLVVFGELFWNPGILVQAEDRAHRIGQQDIVSVQYLVSQGTADDHVWPLVQKKLDVLNKAGLSKDDFSSADTTHLKDKTQTDMMQFFEESFMEEDEAECSHEETTSLTDDTESSRIVAALTPKKGKQQASLFSYFSTSPKKKIDEPDSATKCANVTETSQEVINDLDFEDDFDWTDDVMEPDNKKPRIL